MEFIRFREKSLNVGFADSINGGNFYPVFAFGVKSRYRAVFRCDLSVFLVFFEVRIVEIYLVVVRSVDPVPR